MKTQHRHRNLFFSTIAAAVITNGLLGLYACRIDALRFEWVGIATAIDLVLLISAGLIWFMADRKGLTEKSRLAEVLTRSEKSNRALQQLIEKRNEELRNTVHDLKNPLGSIKGYSDLISEESTNAEVVNEMAHALKRISDHTLELVNSLIEPDGKTPNLPSPFTERPLDIAAYIDDICNAFIPQLREKSQVARCLHTDRPLIVSGEPRRVYDMFMNLIGNAIKFAPKNTVITIDTRINGDFAEITIDDEGPGFSERDKACGFKPFNKLSAKPTGEELSSGLGLNICHQTALAHRGSIEILDNPLGQGARIFIKLPIQPLGL